MARVTVEDCLDNVENRFELVLLASKRARQIAMGKDPMVPWENDKPTVVALREIAEGKITRKLLEDMEAKEREQEMVEQAEQQVERDNENPPPPSVIDDLPPTL